MDMNIYDLPEADLHDLIQEVNAARNCNYDMHSILWWDTQANFDDEFALDLIVFEHEVEAYVNTL